MQGITDGFVKFFSRPGSGTILGGVVVRIGDTVSWRAALGIGAAQALALIPGFSRSGATMGGGLLVGLSNEDAARFAFLLATPIIGAAAVLKLPDLFGSAGDGVRGPELQLAPRGQAVPGPAERHPGTGGPAQQRPRVVVDRAHRAAASSARTAGCSGASCLTRP